MQPYKQPASQKAHPYVANTRKSSAPRGSITLNLKVKKRMSKKTTTIKVPGKRGPKGHFLGAEADFLWSKSSAYLAASAAGTSGQMSLATARELVGNFGESAFHDGAVPNDGDAGMPCGDETSNEAEADRHTARLDVLSTVSCPR